MAVDAKGLWFEIQAAYTDQVTPGVNRTAQTVDQQANRMQNSLNKVGAQGPGAGLQGYLGAIRGVAVGANLASQALPGFSGQVASSSSQLLGLASSASMAKEGFSGLGAMAKQSGLGMAGFGIAATAIAVALAAWAWAQSQLNAEIEKNQKLLKQNLLEQHARQLAETYRHNRELVAVYDSLAKKANRTAMEEATLLTIRQQLVKTTKELNSAQQIRGNKGDIGVYSEAAPTLGYNAVADFRKNVVGGQRAQIEAERGRLQASLVQLKVDLLNQANQSGAEAKKIRQQIAETVAALAPLNKALDDTAKKNEKINTTLPKQSELLQEIEDELNAVTRATWALWEAQEKASRGVDITGVGAASLVNGPAGRDFSRIFQQNEADQARALREQEAFRRAQYDAIGINAEQARVSVEADFTLSPAALESQRAYIDMMEEIRYLEAELAQLSPEEAAAQRENYYNRMAIASQRYQTTLKRLEHEQSVVRNVTQNMTRAFQSAYVAAVLGQQSFAQAFRMAAAEYIAGESAKAMIGEIMETAHGFAALASHRYADAAFHFKSAAFYAAVGAASGMAAKALAGGGGGAGGGGEGGGGGQQYGPREYSNEDLARIRAQGQQATGGAAEGGQPGTTTIINNNNFKIAESVNVPDPKAMARYIRSQGAQLMEGMVRESSRNGALAQRFGRLSNREE